MPARLSRSTGSDAARRSGYRGSRRARLLGALCLGLLLLLTLSACGPRYRRVVVHDDRQLIVTLRSETRDGEPVDRDFSHPATISAVRLGNILSRIDVRMLANDGERLPAIPTGSVFEIAAALSKALAQADPSQEVVVQSLEVKRRLGIFTDKHLTGLVVWVDGDELVVHLTHRDAAVEKGRNARLPEPWPDRASNKFKLLAGPSMVPVGQNAVSIAWRDASFRRRGNVTIDASGRAVRRTILLESPEQAEELVPADQALPPDLSPAALRALADLEEERRAGGISEADYQDRRRAILESDGSQP